MFYEFDLKTPQPSFKDRAIRLLSIALGNIDPTEEEVDKIDKYGYLATKKEGRKNPHKVHSEEEFIQALKSTNATLVDAEIYVTRNKNELHLPRTITKVLDSFHHSITFRSVSKSGREFEYSVSFGDQMGNGNAETYPYSDTSALRTYVTAGNALVNLKNRFPDISTRLLTSNRGVHLLTLDGRASFSKAVYYEMVRSARKNHVEPWK